MDELFDDCPPGLSQEYVREVLDYNPETGLFRWKRKPRNGHVGKIAGGLTSSGQWDIGLDGTSYKAHSLAWLYMRGCWPKMVDHINGNPIDNRIENLRPCNASQNQWNRGLSKNNTSGFKGVSWRPRRQKWYAAIQVHGKTKYLGSFDTAADASAAYERAADKYHKDWRRLA